MRKTLFIVSLLLLLAGCNDREKIAQYNEGDTSQQKEIEQMLKDADDIEKANILLIQNELFVALQVNPWDKWNKQKIEKRWKDKLEKKYPHEMVTVSTDFKIFWESSKLMKEKKQDKVLEEIQQLKKLAKEET